jgi:hypothetical protein
VHTTKLHLEPHQYKWDFIVADVSRPLLGANFLCASSLLVDLNGKHLVDAESYFSIPLHKIQETAPHLDSIYSHSPTCCAQLLPISLTLALAPRVTTTSNALLAKYTSIQTSFKETKKKTEAEFMDSLTEHYTLLSEALSEKLDMIKELAQEELNKIPPNGEIAKEHGRLMESMFQNVSDLEDRLRETKTCKLETLKRGGRPGDTRKRNVSSSNHSRNPILAPHINGDKDYVSKCGREPLMQHEVGVDLCACILLVISDYYSYFIEVDHLHYH